MKSKIITFLILIFAFVGFSFKSVNAQYVTIPDANFVSWLQANYPACMSGNQMDTTCAEIVNETGYLYLNFDNLHGIQYFDNLDSLKCPSLTESPLRFPPSLLYLDCSSSYFIDSLSALPKTLLYLMCKSCDLQSLPALPDSLKVLNCALNELTSLPSIPIGLEILFCFGNELTTLPNLPVTLFELDCSNNEITSLPSLFQTSLTDLDIANNNISVLPNLPSTLKLLHANHNFLTALPQLPNLDYLDCWYNLITALPSLPNTLGELGCAQNQLTSLPTLPNSMWILSCSFNNITSLPTLPLALEALFCDHNNISCLPVLPTTFTSIPNFDILNNPITCLPNYVAAMDSVELAFPLCVANDVINNPNNCAAAVGLLGRVFTDSNNDCIMASNELGVKNIQLKFFNSITNQFGTTYAALNGVYSYSATAGNYHVYIDTLNKPFMIDCLTPGNDTIVTTSTLNPFVDNINFEVKCKNALDLSIQAICRSSGIVFPGQQHQLRIIAGDASQWYGLNCSNGTSGQLQLTVTGAVTYIGAVAGSLIPIVNGNTYTYTISDFGLINYLEDFQLLFLTNTSAVAGDQVCVHVEITPLVGDVNPLNNIRDFCYSAVNSFDPNYKEVYPKDVLPGYEDWLTYTIHFQNTGNAPAINIRLLDTLDSNLNVQTFEVINYSHYNTATLMDGVLDFRFPNILLPDSTSDLAGSQGFLQYRIKPNANLPVGTQIENTANIYFDYNAPITTNTTINNFTTTVGLKENNPIQNVTIYPNPSNGIYNLSAQANIEVYNIIGEIILNSNNAKTIDLSGEANGIYFVRMNGITTKKLIKN